MATEIPDDSPNPKLERAILRKVSWRLMPILLLGLFISYMDRANLGVLGEPISSDLGLTASAFGLAAGLFYVGYLIFEIPSNMAMVRFGARIWIARIMISWGLVTVMMAFIQGATSLYILRILLGVAEAGFFPGVLLYLTFWYPARALARSYSIFEIGVPVALALASVITSALLVLDGVLGISGWRWAFFLQGVPAILLGIVVFRYLPDRPSKAAWLNQEEKDYLESQVHVPEADSKSDMKALPKILTNAVAWSFALLYFSMLIGFWSITFFLPRIVKERFAVDTIQAGLISSIPWVFAAIAIYVIGKTSAKTGDRKWHLFGCLGAAGIGLALSAAVGSPVLALIGIALGAAGMQASVPLFWSMPSTYFAGAAAAISLAMINSVGNLSGLIGPYILGFFQDATGNSRTGLAIMAVFFFIAAVLAVVMSTLVTRRTAVHGASSQAHTRH